MPAETVICPGCQQSFLHSDGATHDYLGASAGCWQMYGELLAREYSDMHYMRAHQYTVDAYAVQHPGIEARKTIQSVAVHLISLYALFELQYSIGQVSSVRQRVANSDLNFTWLMPPADVGEINVMTLYDAESATVHNRIAKAWAQEQWERWEVHHKQVKAWASAIGITRE